MITLPEQAKRLRISSLHDLDNLSARIEKEGHKVIRVNIGNTNLPAPREVWDKYEEFRRMHERAPYLSPGDSVPMVTEDGKSFYIRDVWHKIYSHHDLDISDMGAIIPTEGGSEAINYALFLSMEPGQTAMTLQPTYPPFIEFVRNWHGGRMVGPVCRLTKDGWEAPDLQALNEFYEGLSEQDKPAVFIDSNPKNPTGQVFSLRQLEDIGQFVVSHGMPWIYDATYTPLVLDGTKRSPHVLDIRNSNDGLWKELRDHVIIVDSLSKTFNLCGFRLGTIMLYNEELKDKPECLASFRLSVNSPGAYAALGILGMDLDAYFGKERLIYKARNDSFIDALTGGGITAVPTQGALYNMPDFGKDVPGTSSDVARFLLEHVRVDDMEKPMTAYITPGAGFYSVEEPGQNPGRHQARIALMADAREMGLVGRIMSEGLDQYKARH